MKPWLACAVFVLLAGFGGSWVTATSEVRAGQAAATCSCGCGGTPRPACAHSCGGTPCTGGAMSHSRIIVGDVVENQPATVSVVAPNGRVLTGFVVEFGKNQKVTTDDQGRGIVTPTSRGTLRATVDGVTGTDVHCVSAAEAAKAGSHVPRFTTAGIEMIVTHAGHFDGRAANTQASIGATSCPVLFEAPHQAILRVPPDAAPGAAQLRVVDQGRTLERPIRVVRFSMQVDRTTLARGESTQGKVTIEGADASLVGGVIRLQNMSTETIALRLVGSGGTDKVEKRVDAGMIRDGRIELPMSIQGRRGGTFTIVGGIHDPQGMSAPKCSCGCGGTPRPACAHSCGGNPCTGAGLRK